MASPETDPDSAGLPSSSIQLLEQLVRTSFGVNVIRFEVSKKIKWVLGVLGAIPVF